MKSARLLKPAEMSDAVLEAVYHIGHALPVQKFCEVVSEIERRPALRRKLFGDRFGAIRITPAK